jgi:hypothetical protein
MQMGGGGAREWGGRGAHGGVATHANREGKGGGDASPPVHVHVHLPPHLCAHPPPICMHPPPRSHAPCLIMCAPPSPSPSHARAPPPPPHTHPMCEWKGGACTNRRGEGVHASGRGGGRPIHKQERGGGAHANGRGEGGAHANARGNTPPCSLQTGPPPACRATRPSPCSHPLCNVHTACNPTWVLVATRWLLAR